MPMTMNEEFVLFNYELGSTINLWASVEHSLALLASACVGPGEYMTITSGFFGIENFRSKREFVSRMVQSMAAERTDVINAWATLDERVSRASEVRNQLVHRTMSIYETAPIGRRYALIEYPELFRTNGSIVMGTATPAKLPPSGAVCLHQLAEAQSRFFGVNFSLMNFRDLLQGNPKFFPESYEQGYAALDLAALDTRFRKALGLPRRLSSRSRPAPGDEAAERERKLMREEAKKQ